VGVRIILIANSVVKYGTTRMEVDIDGSFSYAESQNDAKDSGKIVYFQTKVKLETIKFLVCLPLILEDNHNSYHSFGCYFGWHVS